MIVGAGLAGLIAAHAFPKEEIVEAAPEPRQAHNALLRFRSTAVADIVGIEFRQVEVRKGIWLNRFVEPNIRVANLYSQKVIGRLLSRSIWDVNPVSRFVAPSDLYPRLVESVGRRIHWNTKARFGLEGGVESLINTAPLPVVLAALGYTARTPFNKAGITVQRFLLPKSDVFQTIYFPALEHSLYRASITGNLLICEFTGKPQGEWSADVHMAFGLGDLGEALGEVEQKYGKIAPIDENERRYWIAKLTHEHNIFSLGRFATWRNILLDDVAHDIAVVRRLLKASHYERKLYAAK